MADYFFYPFSHEFLSLPDVRVHRTVDGDALDITYRERDIVPGRDFVVRPRIFAPCEGKIAKVVIYPNHPSNFTPAAGKRAVLVYYQHLAGNPPDATLFSVLGPIAREDLPKNFRGRSYPAGYEFGYAANRQLGPATLFWGLRKLKKGNVSISPADEDPLEWAKAVGAIFVDPPHSTELPLPVMPPRPGGQVTSGEEEDRQAIPPPKDIDKLPDIGDEDFSLGNLVGNLATLGLAGYGAYALYRRFVAGKRR